MAFDSDATLRERWAMEAPEATFLDEAGLAHWIEAGLRADAVVCALVLYSVDRPEMERALARLRRLLGDDGGALVAVCDPRAVHVEHTTRHRRLIPAGARYDEPFSYAKLVRDAGARIEHHRPLSAYRIAFYDAGLEAMSEETVDGVDTIASRRSRSS